MEIYMKRLILSFFTMLCISTSIQAASEANLYASVYADFLIDQFDKELDTSTQGSSFLTSETYSRILACREYIESTNGHAHKYKSSSILFVKDSFKYAEVVATINSMAISINNYQQRIKSMNLSKNILYPSLGGTGNVTGNTFPQNVWSLTFDDGPRSGRTQTVVDNLYRYGFEASFFMLMSQAKANKTTVDYVLDHNMELALHSYNHKNLVKVTEEVLEYEIGTAKYELEALGSRSISLFRLPYGSGTRNQLIRTKIAELGMIHIFWNVDTLDWKDKDPTSIYNRTIKQMNLTPSKSGIILFHDIHAQTVIASEKVMSYLSREDKKVCTVGEVISYLNGTQQSCL
jgi:peptidoglycan/xylan/chitin deacetylase (PgdA/CDA1 family)